MNVKRLRSNRGDEYDASSLISFNKEHGIIHEVTPPYSLESNGVTKRKNKTLKEMMNAMIVSSRATLNLWEGSHSFDFPYSK